jgi:hypothetical protein
MRISLVTRPSRTTVKILHRSRVTRGGLRLLHEFGVLSRTEPRVRFVLHDRLLHETVAGTHPTSREAFHDIGRREGLPRCNSASELLSLLTVLTLKVV